MTPTADASRHSRRQTRSSTARRSAASASSSAGRALRIPLAPGALSSPRGAARGVVLRGKMRNRRILIFPFRTTPRALRSELIIASTSRASASACAVSSSGVAFIHGLSLAQSLGHAHGRLPLVAQVRTTSSRPYPSRVDVRFAGKDGQVVVDRSGGQACARTGYSCDPAVCCACVVMRCDALRCRRTSAPAHHRTISAAAKNPHA